jgi:hypothetical protein
MCFSSFQQIKCACGGIFTAGAQTFHKSQSKKIGTSGRGFVCSRKYLYIFSEAKKVKVEIISKRRKQLLHGLCPPFPLLTKAVIAPLCPVVKRKF